MCIPNWCENVLKVTGPAKEIARFKKAAKGRGPTPAQGDKVRPLSLHALVPEPTAELSGEGWYHWRLANWGTKWEIDSKITDTKSTLVEYTFDSAWAPPAEWLTRVGPLFPKLSFCLRYAEGGCNFAGVLTVENDSANNEDKDYLDAMLEMHGVLEVWCLSCDESMEIYTKEDLRVCETCVHFRCANCSKHKEVHLENDKCPFDTTKFKNISIETFNAP